MIIDLILDRQENTNIVYPKTIKDGKILTSNKYNSKSFYNNIMNYYNIFPEIVGPIADALDSGTDNDIKKVLCNYVKNNGYNNNICKYINSVNWI